MKKLLMLVIIATLALAIVPMLAQAHCNAAPAPLHCGGSPSPPNGFIAVQVGSNCVGIGGNPVPYVINGTCPTH